MLMSARARSAAARPLSFPRARRLRTPGDFKRVYAAGRRIGHDFFSVTAQPNELERARLGMAVAVRAMGGAVERNRIRRLIRESFRLHQALVPALDIVIGVRPNARGAAAVELRASLERLWDRLKRSAT
jgi:ribonuclease P protein component